jgi:hypothetical protein
MDKEANLLYIADEAFHNIKLVCAAPCYNVEEKRESETQQVAK